MLDLDGVKLQIGKMNIYILLEITAKLEYILCYLLKLMLWHMMVQHTNMVPIKDTTQLNEYN